MLVYACVCRVSLPLSQYFYISFICSLLMSCGHTLRAAGAFSFNQNWKNREVGKQTSRNCQAIYHRQILTWNTSTSTWRTLVAHVCCWWFYLYTQIHIVIERNYGDWTNEPLCHLDRICDANDMRCFSIASYCIQFTLRNAQRHQNRATQMSFSTCWKS